MEALPGDVILYPVTPRSALSSRFVAAGELLFGAGKDLEEYSHATIKSRVKGCEYGAQWPKTGHFPIDITRAYEIWRIGDPSETQRKRVLEYCQANEGEWYNMIGLLSGGILGLPRTAVCSQFVGNAYAAAHIHISKQGLRLLSPNAIRDFPGAVRVDSFTPKEA